jgi:hypothetical protein
MAELLPDEQEDFGGTLLQHTVPAELVDTVLDKQREQHPFFRYGTKEWEIIKRKQPNLAHFISVTSFEAAPEDPILREMVASSLIGMVSLLDQSLIKEHEEEAKQTSATDAA